MLAPTFTGCCLASFGAPWGLSVDLAWFRQFIVQVLLFSQAEAGLISTLPSVMGATVVSTTEWLSQYLMARGVPGAAPRVGGGLIVLMLPLVDSPVGKAAQLVAGGSLAGLLPLRPAAETARHLRLVPERRAA